MARGLRSSALTDVGERCGVREKHSTVLHNRKSRRHYAHSVHQLKISTDFDYGSSLNRISF